MCTFIGETGSELPVGGPRVAFILKRSTDLVVGCRHIDVGGSVDKSNPDVTALSGVIKHTLDDKVAAAAESDTSK